MSDSQSNSKPVTGLRLLPKGFSPSINEIIIGRGRKVTNHSGNERFRELIYSEIREYSLAENKTAKSSIIFRVLQQIKNASPETGGFVKQDSKTKRWFAVEDATARTTTAQAFRDALSSHYKSSKQFKQQRRWDRKSVSSPSSSRDVPATTETGQIQILPKMPVPAPVTGSAPQTAATPAPTAPVDILPKLPVSFTAFSSFPPLARRPASIAGMGVGSQLGDILNSALETASQVGPFPNCHTSMPPLGGAHSLSCGENHCTREVDLDTLWDTLGVQTVSENPFEPTPISPVPAMSSDKRELASPTTLARQLVQQTMNDAAAEAAAATEQGEKKDHCDVCWETKIQEQIQDNSFWQDSSMSSSTGFSLRKALACCRHV